jgi:MFS family permease
MTYARLLHLPHVRRLVLSALVGRLPIGMTTLALVLFVAGKTGSYTDAGLAEGLVGAGLAVGVPLQGRLIDRLGPRSVLGIAASCMAAGWVTILLIGDDHGPFAALLGVCALTGLAYPALSPTMRRLWPVLVTGGDAQLDAAMALEGVLVEVIYTAGPLIAAGIIAIASPGLVLLCAATMSLLGTLAFVASPVTRGLGNAAAPLGGRAGRLRVLRSRGTFALIAAMFALGGVFGSVQVGVPAFASTHGHGAIAGVALASNSLASMIGGLAYGGWSWHGSMERRYAGLGLILAGCYAPLVIVGTLPALVGLMALAGFALAPFSTALYVLLSKTAPQDGLTEAYSWATAANAAGAAGAAALAGSFAHQLNGRAPFVLGFACAGVLAAIACLGARAATRYAE